MILWGLNLNAVETYRYTIGVGDVLNIRVLGEADFTGQYRVAADGTIDYPYIRRIEVQGKSPKNLGEHIAKLLKDGYLADPHVMVEVKEYHSQKVLVLGAVAKPGTYVLMENTRVLDLISRAGGITEVGGKRILLLRDWENPEENKTLPKNSDQDTKESVSKEKVSPETKESLQPVKEDLSEKTPLAALRKKGAKPKVIDYHRLVHKGDMTENYRLRNGDILNIPKANEIFIFGNVAKPGPVKYEDGMTILQAVTLAGGPTPEASTKSTYILRRNEKGETKMKVRLDRIIENRAKNIPLLANDVVVVPESFF